MLKFKCSDIDNLLYCNRFFFFVFVEANPLIFNVVICGCLKCMNVTKKWQRENSLGIGVFGNFYVEHCCAI